MLGRHRLRRWIALPLGALLALALALVALRRRDAAPDWTVTVRSDPSQSMDLGALRWSPRDAVRSSVRVGRDAVELRIRGGVRALRVSHPEGCPFVVTPSGGATALLRAWVAAPPRVASVGFDAPFAVTVRAGCPQAAAGTVAWRLVAGAPLAAMAVADGGFTLRARTGALDAGPVPAWGIVPVSAAGQRRTVIELTWTGDAHAPLTRTVEVTAAPRASGVTSVAVRHRVYLAGDGWRVAEAPEGSRSRPAREGGLTVFVPEVGGRYALADAAGRRLSVDVARIDDVRLDCGRSDCHASAARESLRSPMSTLGARSMVPGCSVGCHSVGEPGLDDGGFEHITRELGGAVTPTSPSWPWDDLPRDLRRVSSVGCVACHGPAALPPREARWMVLRSEVCAVCHDAPPRYGHSAAWRRTRMAVADRANGVGENPACRRCHSVDGFLRALEVPATVTHPAGELGLGVNCAACHAPHSAGSGRALVRRAPWPASLGAEALPVDSSARVCVSCHSPTADGPLAATAALNWLGRGGVSVEGGAPVSVTSPHASVPGGCLGCHGSASRDHGQGHDFRATPARCATCHPNGAPAEPLDAQGRGYRARVDALRTRSGLAAVAHSTGERDDTATPEGRARHDLRLLSEDPAAWAHGGRYALALLDELERWYARTPQ